MTMEFKSIQQKLNKLCSQHDEYMTLLDIIDYLASLKNATQNNRNVVNKIAQLEQQIQQIKQNQTSLHNQQKQFGTLKLNKFKKNIAAVEQKLYGHSSTISSLELSIKKIEKDCEKFAYHPSINKVNTLIQENIEQEISIVQSSIASFKNQLEVKKIEISKDAQKICTLPSIEQEKVKRSASKGIQNIMLKTDNQQMSIQSLMQKLFKQDLQQYDQLMHQIMLYKLQFSIPPFLPFVKHNCQQIKQKIEWLYCKVNINEILTPSEFSILRQEYETILYRVKALKNHALCELLQLYEEKDIKLQANKLERQIRSLIKQTQNRLQLFHDFMTKAQEIRKYYSSAISEKQQ